MATLLGAAARRLRGGAERAAPTADPDAALAADLRAAIGAERVRADAAARYLVSRDASIYSEGTAGPLCLPTSTEQVAACVRIAADHGRAVVPRGAGTGLAGGAAPLGRPVVLSLTRMNQLLSVDLDNGVAWVQPGMVNLELSRRLAPYGMHYAPDPSSQQACTIGGNVATNSGGPHCLAYGVTSAHVVALEVVLSDASVVTLGDLTAEPAGYDLRGAFVGSEGMCGITTAAAVRLTPDPAAVRTLLIAYDDVSSCAATVGAIIADGIVPAAIEMLDQRCVGAIEDFARAGYPRDAAAVLLVEVDGPPSGVAVAADRVAEIAAANGAVSVRAAADDEERARLWKGRKSAFGAVANILPDYYLHDTVVPRSRLVEVLEQVYEIADRYDLTALNVFHAGDGNLHPILAFDARLPGTMERVHAAGREIIEASLAVGGALSGEHGIGMEKRDYMERMFSDADLDQQSRLRAAFDPHCRMNPGKVLPSAHSCADIGSLRAADGKIWG
ncbi:MAG: FAD-binding protein [bacterium]|nr:FAD-binding protein [bacterium]MDE0668990.1 FAD-binding protein [bacterium]